MTPKIAKAVQMASNVFLNILPPSLLRPRRACQALRAADLSRASASSTLFHRYAANQSAQRRSLFLGAGIVTEPVIPVSS